MTPDVSLLTHDRPGHDTHSFQHDNSCFIVVTSHCSMCMTVLVICNSQSTAVSLLTSIIDLSTCREAYMTAAVLLLTFAANNLSYLYLCFIISSNFLWIRPVHDAFNIHHKQLFH